MSEEANTVEGRLAELMEGAAVRIDRYRLSENHRSKVIAALRENDRLRAELAAVRHHLEAAYEAMGVPLIMSRPLSCYINDLRKELAAERAARIAVASPVRQEGEE